MSTSRFPVLVWKGYDGHHAACLVDRDAPTAVGRTAGEALARLEEYLRWSVARGVWFPEPDFRDARLERLRVAVRPEYAVEGRPQPCEETLALEVVCVLGRQEDGLLVGSLPLLDVRFFYNEPGALPDLVTRYALQALGSPTPRDLARHLPPERVALEEVVVRGPSRRRLHPEEPELPNLNTVAEPMGVRGARRSAGRAWGREAEVAELVRRLDEEGASLVLVGEPGSGKTTLLAQAVQASGRRGAPADGDADGVEAPPARTRRRYWRTGAARLIAGMQY